METPFTIHRSPDEPILTLVLLENYSISQDIGASTAAVKAHLDQADQPLYYILDLSHLKANLDDVMLATSHSARGETPLWHHPSIREIIFVSEAPLMKASAKGLKSAAFGNLERVKIFTSPTEALRYCRSQG
jgi:hypothetical protein